MIYKSVNIEVLGEHVEVKRREYRGNTYNIGIFFTAKCYGSAYIIGIFFVATCCDNRSL